MKRLLLILSLFCFQSQADVVTIKKILPTFRLCEPSKQQTLNVCVSELRHQFRSYTILSTNWTAPSPFSTECIITADIPNVVAQVIDVNQTHVVDALRTETMRSEINPPEPEIKSSSFWHDDYIVEKILCIGVVVWLIYIMAKYSEKQMKQQLEQQIELQRLEEEKIEAIYKEGGIQAVLAYQQLQATQQLTNVVIDSHNNIKPWVVISALRR